MASSTVENYIKQIYADECRQPGERVAMGRLSSAMRVAPGTATAMVKTLAQSGLVDYEPRGGVNLTDNGRSLALHVLRRHRLVELFLVNVLHLDWSEVHEEADAWEHVISERVLDRIDQLLGHPETDPHGDPIPSAGGDLPGGGDWVSLTACDVGEEVVVRQVSDEDSGFLVFLDQSGLRPGARLRLEPRESYAESLSVLKSDGEKITLGLQAASRVRVERI
jgi:DtxR family Mn-dependent transcriptional regulator